MYKKGDITPEGWEIVEVYNKPIYTMRRRVKITTNHSNLNGTLAYYYLYDHPRDNKIISDDGKYCFKLKDNEYEFI